MPALVNGIGTWYFGKRNVHRVKALCSQCNHLAELESYDTTLFAVVLLIPVIPLTKKRVLENCPVCEKHRQLPLKQWNAQKMQAFNDVLAKLQANPDDSKTIQSALAVATIYQDEVAFDKLAEVLAGHRTN